MHPRAIVVDRPRHQPLARPRLAGDQDRGIGGRRPHDAVVERLHRRTLSDHAVEATAQRPRSSRLEPAEQRRRLEHHRQLRRQATESSRIVRPEHPPLVEHLQRPQRAPLRPDRHAHHAARSKARLGIDRRAKPRVILHPGEHQRLPRPNHMPRDPFAAPQSDLRHLGEVTGHGHEIPAARLDQEERAPLGLHRRRHRIDGLADDPRQLHPPAEPAAHRPEDCVYHARSVSFRVTRNDTAARLIRNPASWDRPGPRSDSPRRPLLRPHSGRDPSRTPPAPRSPRPRGRIRPHRPA